MELIELGFAVFFLKGSDNEMEQTSSTMKIKVEFGLEIGEERGSFPLSLVTGKKKT